MVVLVRRKKSEGVLLRPPSCFVGGTRPRWGGVEDVICLRAHVVGRVIEMWQQSPKKSAGEGARSIWRLSRIRTVASARGMNNGLAGRELGDVTEQAEQTNRCAQSFKEALNDGTGCFGGWNFWSSAQGVCMRLGIGGKLKDDRVRVRQPSQWGCDLAGSMST